MNIVKWVLLAIGSISMVVTAGIAVWLVVNPPKKTEPPVEVKKVVVSTMDSITVDSLLTPEQKLELQNEVLQSELEIKEEMIDSMQTLLSANEAALTENKRLVKNQKNEIVNLKKTKSSTEELAKTFQNMKVEELRPILKQINDETALKIYTMMSGRSRKKLLLGLSESRAAKLTERIVGTAHNLATE